MGLAYPTHLGSPPGETALGTRSYRLASGGVWMGVILGYGLREPQERFRFIPNLESAGAEPPRSVDNGPGEWT
jgi:hypothetical protein